MATKTTTKATKKEFDTIPAGTEVTWHYRSAIGHGTVRVFSRKERTRITPSIQLNNMIIIRVNQLYYIIMEKH